MGASLRGWARRLGMKIFPGFKTGLLSLKIGDLCLLRADGGLAHVLVVNAGGSDGRPAPGYVTFITEAGLVKSTLFSMSVWQGPCLIFGDGMSMKISHSMEDIVLNFEDKPRQPGILIVHDSGLFLAVEKEDSSHPKIILYLNVNTYELSRELPGAQIGIGKWRVELERPSDSQGLRDDDILFSFDAAAAILPGR
jgi:hypothetical protein